MSELLKSRHAFGNSENIEAALDQNLVDAYDILFLDGDTDKPKIGWIDKNGKLVMVTDEKADLSGVEAELKEVNAEVDAVGLRVDDLDSKVAKKANVEEVDSKIDTAVADVVDEAEAKFEEIKFEIASKPVGALVNYSEKEIRVMCPVNTVWTKQTVGSTGNANMYYMQFRAYAPKDAVSFKEGDRGVIIDKMFTFDDDFAGTDEFGRNYSVCWLALASYNESTDTWTYFGKNSSEEKYIGWDYVVQWFDANGVMIASDGIRINLSNEDCHASSEPYYIGNAIKTAKEYTDAQIAAAIEVIEF